MEIKNDWLNKQINIKLDPEEQVEIFLDIEEAEELAHKILDIIDLWHREQLLEEYKSER